MAIIVTLVSAIKSLGQFLAIMGFFCIVGLAVAWLLTTVQTPAQVIEDSLWKQSEVYDSTLNVKLELLKEKSERTSKALEAATIIECLNNSEEKIVQQRLVDKCIELGIKIDGEQRD